MIRSRFPRGFTLIEIMMVVALVGILAALAIPTFVKHSKKAKNSEAKIHLERLYNSAKIYFEINNRFADVAGGPTPALAAACAGSSPVRHAPNAANWSISPWTDLGFQMNDPHIYSYQYEAGATSFSAIAVGDIDCDGQRSGFTMSASSSGGEFQGSPLVQDNPHE